MAEPAPHFIGWLPMPRVLARFLLPVTVGAVVGFVVLAVLLADGQRSPGHGVWEDRTTTLVGIAYAEPYAMVRVPGDDGTAATVLLVEEGKHGAKERVRAFDGRPVRVRGTPIQRDGWRMLELAAGDDGLRSTELPEPELTRLRRPPPRPLGRLTVRGEIVDSKCYLGAMKPGDGRTHRGCALLCLKGGIPPLFISRSEGTGPAIYLVASESGGPASDSLIDLAGLPVVVDGAIEEYGDFSVIRVGPRGARVE